MATFVGPVAASPGLPGGTHAALNVTAATVIKAAAGILNKITCSVAGSITISDTTTTGGGTATNLVWSGSLTAGQVLVLDWPCGTGITVTALTTAVVAVSYS
jgi:hypothetical protein